MQQCISYSATQIITSDFMQQCSKPNLAYRLRLHAAICEPNPFPQTSCNNVFQTLNNRHIIHAAMFETKFSLSHQTSRSDLRTNPLH